MTSTTNHQTSSNINKEELLSLFQQDLGKVFFDNGLDALANRNSFPYLFTLRLNFLLASEFNFVETGMSNAPHSGTLRMNDPFLRSPYKPEANNQSDFLPGMFSPARSATSRGEDAHPFGFGQNSVLCSPFKSDARPKLNFSHKYLRSEFKNPADYQDEEIVFDYHFPNEESLSLMWDPASATKFKQEQHLADQSNLQRKLENDFDKNNFDCEDTYDSNLEDYSMREPLKKANVFEPVFEKNYDPEMMSMSHDHFPESTQDHTRFSGHMDQDMIKLPKRAAYFDQSNLNLPYNFEANLINR